MRLFTPQYLFARVTRITPGFLRERGITTLVLDVDNTLTEHGSQHLPEDIGAWLQEMDKAGIRMMIASNNKRARVEPFAQKLGLHCAWFCCKPSPHYLLALKKRWKVHRREVALVGDQIFTDALAGHLWGVTVLLVRPMARDTKPTVRLKRMLEAPFLLRYYHKGGKLL